MKETNENEIKTYELTEEELEEYNKLKETDKNEASKYLQKLIERIWREDC